MTIFRKLTHRKLTVPAEGEYDQEVADHPGDADGEDDGADGVVGVVGDVHRGEGVGGLRHHGQLGNRKQEMMRKRVPVGLSGLVSFIYQNKTIPMMSRTSRLFLNTVV